MQLFGNKKDGKHGPNAIGDKDTEINSTDGDEYSNVPADTAAEVIDGGEAKQRRRGLKTLYVVLGVLAVIIIGFVIVLEVIIKAPDVSVDGPTNPVVESEPPDDGQDDGDAPETAGSGRRDGVYTFLIAGCDMVADNTDTIMVGTLDTVAGTLNIVNIPRDTMCNVPYHLKRINNVYHAAAFEGGDAIGDLKDAVKDLLGYSVDNYAVIDVEACARIVDIIGGVTFNVPTDMYYDDPVQDLHIAIPAGEQLLNGENFVKVMRFRDTYAGGDIERIGVQQELLKALAKQTLTLGNIKNLGELLQVCEDYVDTDLSANNIYFYIQQFLKLSMDNITFTTLPHEAGTYDNLSYVFIHIDEWLTVVNEKLNPYGTEITKANVDIITKMNGNLYSTTGGLESGFQGGRRPDVYTY